MKRLKNLILLIALTVFSALQLHAREGMYLLSDIPELMPQLLVAGCECTGQQLYSADGTSLANQVPHFGRGCTSEIVSANGLLLTNYHCAHGSIQSVSSVEHDYLKNGFWAKNYGEELPVKGLSVRVPIKVVDVSEEVLSQIEGLDKKAKDKKKNEILSQIIQFEKSKGEDISASVREMLGGTKFVLFVSRIFNDVRLVGVPPSSLGKFGGDRDNWMWPRHTADFSFLRIYADANGKPAPYNAANKPLETPYHMNVSMDGVAKDDFIFILGYPGSTKRYSTSFEVQERRDIINKIRYKVRTEKLNVMKAQMAKNDTIRIKYSSKQAAVANYWKHAKDQNIAFDKIQILDRKRAKEAEFMKWVKQSPERKAEYGNVFANIKKSLAERSGDLYELMLDAEALGGMDFVNFVGALKNRKYYQKPENAKKIAERAERFYQNADIETETQIMAALLKTYFEMTKNNQLVDIQNEIKKNYAGDYSKYVHQLVANSPFKTFEGYKELVLYKKDTIAIDNDKLYQLGKVINGVYDAMKEKIKEPTERFYENQKLYKKGIAKSSKELLAPDANSTIRLTYGHVNDLTVEGKTHPYFTTLDGVMKKYNADSEFYELPEKFVELYKQKKFGRYEVNGSVPTCFIATANVTGGNSGSPVFDSKGRLIGLLFDGNSEGLSGDYQFDKDLVRSIILDIRYVLYITEMLGESSHIINELAVIKSEPQK